MNYLKYDYSWDQLALLDIYLEYYKRLVLISYLVFLPTWHTEILMILGPITIGSFRRL